MPPHKRDVTAPAPLAPRALVDPFGRRVTYLRLSVTDRCDLRCRYCMPVAMRFAPGSALLGIDALARVGLAFVRHGVTRIRLTGGEPLVRRDVLALVQRLGAAIGPEGLHELTLTTNGTQLARHADALFDAGVRRVNVSLDTLDPEGFRTIARGGELGAVLAGVEAAARVGLAVKINTVALAGLNEGAFVPMARWCAAHGHELTFIETMPMGDVEDDRTDRYLPLARVREALAAELTLEPDAHRTGGPARYFRARETGQRIGFITPMSGNFCEGCNRVRVTATGTLYPCLGQEGATDLRAALAQGDDDALDRAIAAAVGGKPRGHDFGFGPGAGVTRHMSVTGG